MEEVVDLYNHHSHHGQNQRSGRQLFGQEMGNLLPSWYRLERWGLQTDRC